MKEYEVIVQSLWRFSETIVVEADSKEEALERALDDHECDWSDSNRLDIEGFVLAERDPEETGAIRAVVDYLFEDEKRDFENAPKSERTRHVFTALRLLKSRLPP